MLFQNHITNRCFSKMLRTVLEGSVSNLVFHKFGDLQEVELHLLEGTKAVILRGSENMIHPYKLFYE